MKKKQLLLQSTAILLGGLMFTSLEGKEAEASGTTNMPQDGDITAPDAPIVTPIKDKDRYIKGFAEPNATVLIMDKDGNNVKGKVKPDGTFKIKVNDTFKDSKKVKIIAYDHNENTSPYKVVKVKDTTPDKPAETTTKIPDNQGNTTPSEQPSSESTSIQNPPTQNTIEIPSIVIPPVNNTIEVPSIVIPPVNDTTEAPSVVIPPVNNTTEVPSVVIPPVNNTTEVPSVVIPPVNNTTEVPSVVIPPANNTTEVPGGGSTTEMPTTEVPGGSSTTEMPTTEVPGGGSTTETPTTEVPGGSGTTEMPTTEVPGGGGTTEMPTTEVPGGGGTTEMPTTEMPKPGTPDPCLTDGGLDTLRTGMRERYTINESSTAQSPAIVTTDTSNLSIGDHVWWDENWNNMFDANEKPVAGLEVSLRDYSGNEVGRTVTDAQGNYKFEGLESGTYILNFHNPLTWSPVIANIEADLHDFNDSDGPTDIIVNLKDNNLNVDQGYYYTGLTVDDCLPTTEVPSTEVPTTEVPSIEVPTTEAPSTEVPTTEVPSTEVPTTEVPSTEVPTTEAPSTEVPTTEVPSTEVPTTEVPSTEVPTTEAPSTEVPTTEVPSTEVPTTEAPTTEVPTTEAPTTEVPTTEAPTTEVPTTEVPSTEVPTTEVPSTEVPTTETPSTEVPTTEAPSTEAPTTEAPTTEAPTTEVPSTEVPTTEAPSTEAPTTETPTTEAPSTEVPTTEASTTEAPTTEVPTTEVPTTEAPTTEAPTTEVPTTEVPTTEAPTTETPGLYSIGDYTWYDDDNDNVQDPEEAPFPNVVVYLYDVNYNLIATTTTDANGNYIFNDIAPGDYTVMFETPNGTRPSNPDDIYVTITDSDILTADKGFYTPPINCTLSYNNDYLAALWADNLVPGSILSYLIEDRVFSNIVDETGFVWIDINEPKTEPRTEGLIRLESPDGTITEYPDTICSRELKIRE